jgi:hypothetical protein
MYVDVRSVVSLSLVTTYEYLVVFTKAGCSKHRHLDVVLDASDYILLVFTKTVCHLEAVLDARELEDGDAAADGRVEHAVGGAAVHDSGAVGADDEAAGK